MCCRRRRRMCNCATTRLICSKKKLRLVRWTFSNAKVSPKLLNLPKDFKEISFLLFLLCLAATILAGLFRCLATGRFHPSKTLFARKRSSRESEREVEAEAAENTGFQPE